MGQERLKTGVIGCGAISDIYLKNMINEFNNLEVVACAAGHLENALKKAEQYGIKGCTVEELLADGGHPDAGAHSLRTDQKST